MSFFKRQTAGLNQLFQGGIHWQIAGLLLVICISFAIFGDAGRDMFQYDRLRIENGEYWRLITGHFVHLGTMHLALNMVGLVLVWLLVGRYFSRQQWLIVILSTIAMTSAGFWFFDTHMFWYVGLSGGLHGLLVAGAIKGYRTLPSESVIIIAIVIGKLAWEQFFGPLPGSESVSSGPVVINAHLFGAIGGVLAVVILGRSVPADPSI